MWDIHFTQVAPRYSVRGYGGSSEESGGVRVAIRHVGGLPRVHPPRALAAGVRLRGTVEVDEILIGVTEPGLAVAGQALLPSHSERRPHARHALPSDGQGAPRTAEEQTQHMVAT